MLAIIISYINLQWKQWDKIIKYLGHKRLKRTSRNTLYEKKINNKNKFYNVKKCKSMWHRSPFKQHFTTKIWYTFESFKSRSYNTISGE